MALLWALCQRCSPCIIAVFWNSGCSDGPCCWALVGPLPYLWIGIHSALSLWYIWVYPQHCASNRNFSLFRGRMSTYPSAKRNCWLTKMLETILHRLDLNKLGIVVVQNAGNFFGAFVVRLYRIRIIKTIIRPNTNRIRIVTLNFEAMSLSFVIINISIVILDNACTFNITNLSVWV